MTLREKLQIALKESLRAREADRLSTLRLINAAIKDREIALRGQEGGTGNAEGEGGVDEAAITAILSRMVKQRQESARVYEEGGRLELAQKELDEIKVIEEFLPRQLSPEEVDAAIGKAITAVGASGIRDMGKVMGELKSHYTGQMDFAAVGPMVKSRLS
ncbi:GatB/YqeY domain-containing protein [Szabonella alba]|uniref:GatB/YqeY domain-containing protein n=1 Tax=Szabonella alba TaxID=2804194 RepID=A0A8K0VDC6_9RHOB|nr:GatB/YqeY domain-containing protein [Szabonella alba]MBL4917624.1 GatB/YqeY domain-containing protein [Szabonella alba]